MTVRGRVVSTGFEAGDVRRIIWSFVFGAVGFFAVQAPGMFDAKNYPDGKAFVFALVAGAVSAGVSAVKNYLAGPAVK